MKIVNVVVSAQLDQEIDLEAVARSIPKTMYEPSIFSGLVYRKDNPKSTVIMFKSGKITSVGSKSEQSGEKSLQETAFELGEKIDIKYLVKDIKTVNIIAIASIEQKINLEKIVMQIRNVLYDKHKFPGARIKLNKNKLMIFSTGKIISVGCKSEKKAKESIKKICNLLEKENIIK